MKHPRRCIISYACKGREDYPVALKRMIGSALDHGWGSDIDNAFLIVSPDCDADEVQGVKINRAFPASVPSHKDVPYGFKPYLFDIAFQMGFEQVLWCDSTIVVHKSLDRIWEIAQRDGGTFFHNTGCPICFWTADIALNAMGAPLDCMEDEIMACAMALDIRHEKGRMMFREWMALARDGVTFQGAGGSTRENFKGHRHDQSAMSWLRFKHAVPMQAYGMLCYHNDREKFQEHILANTGVYQI